MIKRETWAIALTLATLLLAACGGQSTEEKQVNLESAMADYDEAIRLDPTDAEAYYNRGELPRPRAMSFR